MLELKSVCIDYPIGKECLRAVECADALFPDGEISAVVGPSGAGKTSLIQAMAGLLRPSAGLILANGQPVSGVSSGSSVIFQDYGLLPWKTVRANVELPLLLKKLPRAERQTKVMAVLKEMGLADFAAFYPARLSGGMRQRVAVARALISDPQLLLMDEPFSSLDAITREGLQELLLGLMRKRRITCVIVTHSIEEAAFLADRVFIMRGHAPGRLGPPLLYPAAGMRGPDFRESPAYFERCSSLRAALKNGATQAAVSTSPRPAPAAPALAPSAPLPESAAALPAAAALSAEEAPQQNCGSSAARAEAPAQNCWDAAGAGPAFPSVPEQPSTGIPNLFRRLLESRFLRGLGAFILVVGIWALSAALLNKAFLPAPGLAFARFFARLCDGSLLIHLAASARRIGTALIATALPATALGFAAGRSKKADAFISPFVYLFHPLPKVAFLPVIMLLFGLGDLAKDILIGLIIFGQILVAARDAAKAVEPGLVESVRSLGAGQAQILRHVVFPSSLPALLTALRIGLGTAIAILFLAETFATESGLGYFVMDAWARVDYPDMYAAIVALSAFGLLVYALIDAAEDWLCRWRRRD